VSTYLEEDDCGVLVNIRTIYYSMDSNIHTLGGFEKFDVLEEGKIKIERDEMVK
jgi:hypothetical protein